MTTAPAQPATTAAPKRMALANVQKGRRSLPPRVVLYGTEGIGKSTFGAGAPSPIFLGAEDGTSELNVSRFPEPATFEDALDAVRELGSAKHEYRTLVIDSLDWLEPLIWDYVCRTAKATSIEKVGGGFGKGYVEALSAWRLLLSALDRLRHEAGMAVVLIAHAHAKLFSNPAGDDYDRFNLKLNDKAAGLVREWCDALLFAQHEVFVDAKDGRKAKAYGSGKRLLHTEQQAAFHAKNRYGLPATMALSWADFIESMSSRKPEEFRARIDELLASCTDEALAKAVREHVAKIGDDIQRLSEAENRLKGRVNQ